MTIFLRKISIVLMVLLLSVDTYIGANNTKNNDNPCELHVFVHGSFGVEFACLSYNNVINDTIKGSSYLLLQQMMHGENSYQYRRFAGNQGLVEVTAFNSLPYSNLIRHVIGAFHSINSFVNNASNHRYFVFGWSGLLSQRERQREAIFLYNELVALTAAVRVEGKKPIIKLYSSSHGCNVALNLALVDACTFDPAALSQDLGSSTIDCMNHLLNGSAVSDLPKIMGEKKAQKIKHLFEKPKQRLAYIASLVLLGVPLQEETEPLVISSLFSHVLQIHSENDGIVLLDVFSSKKPPKAFFDDKFLRNRPSIKVIRWMNNRTPLDYCEQCEQEKKTPLQKLQFDLWGNFSLTRLNSLLDGGGNPDCHHPQDPTHQDFWCVDYERKGLFFEQVPLVVFMPIMYQLLAKAGDAQNLDFCLMAENKKVQALLFDSTNPQASILLASSKKISLKPVKKARKGAQYVLDVRKKFNLTIAINKPKKVPFLPYILSIFGL